MFHSYNMIISHKIHLSIHILHTCRHKYLDVLFYPISGAALSESSNWVHLSPGSGYYVIAGRTQLYLA